MSNKCTSCKEPLPPDNDFVSCSVRKCKLHYNCAGISEKTYRTMGKQRVDSYKCVLCRNIDKDCSPNVSTDVSSPTINIDSPAFDQNSLQLILNRFDSFEEKLSKKVDENYKKLKSEITGLTQSVQFCSDKIDDFKKELVEFNDKVKALEKSNTELESKNRQLTQQVDHLFIQVEEMQQYSRNMNLQVDGIPETKGENVLELVNKLAIAIDHPITLNNDIQAAHRLASSNKSRPPSIVIRFSNRQKRDNVLDKCKMKRLTTIDFVDNVPSSPVFVNEHLTLFNKKILYEAKRYRFAKKVKYVWVKNSKIFMREDDNSKTVRISKYEDLLTNFGHLEDK